MSEISIENKKLLVSTNLTILKGILKENGLVIAFNKDDDELVFLDRELYLSQNKYEGFTIPFSSLSY